MNTNNSSFRAFRVAAPHRMAENTPYTYYAIKLGRGESMHVGLFESLSAAAFYAASHYRHIDYSFCKIQFLALSREAAERIIFNNAKAQDVRGVV